jgi:hypothetical protein
MIFVDPHTINGNEFTRFLYSCYNHFCAASFQLNMVAFFKRHFSPFAFYNADSFVIIRRDPPRFVGGEQLGG